VGGQFAHTAHAEPDLSLQAPTVGSDFVAGRLEEFGLPADLTERYLDQVVDRLNTTRDFSDPTIVSVANELHVRDQGFTLHDAVRAQEGIDTLRSTGHNIYADAMQQILLARRDGATGVTPVGSSGSVTAEIQVPVPNGKDIPVPAHDPRVQAGQVFERVAAENSVFVHSSVSGYPQDTQAIRFQANRPLTDDEAYALSGIVGYANRAAVGGEPLDDPQYGPSRDSSYSFIARIDTNKGRQGDFEKFEAMIPDIMENGTAPRSSKGGTRAIEPFGDPDLKLEIYYAE
jgi:hypothetical protein